MQSKPRDSSDEWMAAFLGKRVELPSMPFVGNLKNFVKQPLHTKIRAKKRWLNKWPLSTELQEKMFVVDEAAPCREFKNLIFGEFVLRRYRGGYAKSSYYISWDLSFRNLLDVMFPQALLERYSSDDLNGEEHSDFECCLNDVCIFRGEEEVAGIALSKVRQKLQDKTNWVYGTMPYVFGYVASDYRVELVALCHEVDGVHCVPIQNFSLECPADRFHIVLALLNLGLLFSAITEDCPDSGLDEHRTIVRFHGTIVRLKSTFVEKQFANASGFDHLERVYNVLSEANVPNVDRLTSLSRTTNVAVFEPRGMKVTPSSLFELLGALHCILEALVVMHRMGWMHRDIRWSNVLKQRSNDTWFLIDFSNAATSPQPSSSDQPLSVEEHALSRHFRGKWRPHYRCRCLGCRTLD